MVVNAHTRRTRTDTHEGSQTIFGRRYSGAKLNQMLENNSGEIPALVVQQLFISGTYHPEHREQFRAFVGSSERKLEIEVQC